jgi:predicted alpha/beta hydrolase family esterase
MFETTTAADSYSPRRVVIVHGYGASPDAHWFPWLAETAGRAGIEVEAVRLPDPESPDAAAWEGAVGRAVGVPDEATWIVAHSLGGITTLRLLAGLPGCWRLGGLLLVAGFTRRLPALPALDPYLATDVDVAPLIGRIGVRAVIRSDADELVPAAASDALAQRLEAELHLQPGAGHFLAEDGVTSLPIVAALMRIGAESRNEADRYRRPA